MNKNLKLIPIWLWVTVIIIMVLLFSSCRGGRSLGSGSTGTVIEPQTPKQINERNRQPPPKRTQLLPTPPTVITPPPIKKVTIPTVKSTPAPPKSVTIKPIIPVITVKEEKLNPITPPTLKVDTKVNVIKLPEKNEENDNDGVITLDPREENGFPEERPFIKWGELISYWLFVILMVVFGWIAYDTVMGVVREKKLQKKENDTAKKAQEKLIKKPAKGSRKSRKKAISKKGKK